MNRREHVQDFLARKRIAMVGVSRNAGDFSRTLFRELLRRGYDVVPVHPAVSEIDGRPCFSRLQSIFPPVEGALLLTTPDVTDKVVRDCVEAGIQRVWMHRSSGAGAVSPRAVEYCASQGVSVVAGECPFMFFAHPGFIHGLHGTIRKITGTYPR
ncbi:MAG: CoA-binding protein [Terriglobia bacterium]|nr:MAG: CoA-binding protein [Terriglobia bacterium]